MPQFETEFIVQQYYKVTVDESAIDEQKAIWKAEPEWLEEHLVRLHRMFQAILADKRALYTVLEYQVLRKNDAYGDGVWSYLEEHYGKELSLPEVLIRVADCFQEEDRAWLQDLAEKNAKPYEEGDGDNYELDELAECFKVEASGWNVGEHTHARKGNQP
jgi:hypothetical protein